MSASPSIMPANYVSPRSLVTAWLKTCPGAFRGSSESAVMHAARDACGGNIPLAHFEAALRSSGYVCDAARRSYGADGKPGVFVVMLRLPEKPRGAR